MDTMLRHARRVAPNAEPTCRNEKASDMPSEAHMGG